MTDKSIADLTEIFTLDPDDFLVVETAAGTRKIRRSSVSFGQRATPTMLQKGTLRNDGTIALPSAPTVGNLMVHIQGGFNSYQNYTPAGFTNVAIFSSNANNYTVASIRRVQSGDTGSYAVSATDNQFCALYEYEDADSVVGIIGGPAPFTGSSMTIGIPKNPFQQESEMFVCIEGDTTVFYVATPETGLTIDYQPVADGANHVGAIYRTNPTFDGSLNITASGTPQTPVYGVFAITGRFI